MRRLPAFLFALTVLAACGDGSGEPEAPRAGELASAEAVTEAMRGRFEANQGAVDSFVVVGGGGRAVHARNAADTTGQIPFTIDLRPLGGAQIDPDEIQLHYNLVPNVVGLADGMAEAEFGGVVERDGRRAYVLSTGNPAALLGGVPPPGEHELRVYVDAETFDVVEIFRSAVTDTTKAAITDRLLYSDFQETDGLVLPRTVRRVVSGVNRDLTEELKVREMGNIALQRAQADRMPEGPERQATLALADRQERIVTEGVAETTLTVESVVVGAGARPDASPAPTP